MDQTEERLSERDKKYYIHKYIIRANNCFDIFFCMLFQPSHCLVCLLGYHLRWLQVGGGHLGDTLPLLPRLTRFLTRSPSDPFVTQMY